MRDLKCLTHTLETKHLIHVNIIIICNSSGHVESSVESSILSRLVESV